MSGVDDRIVSMKFDNGSFEKKLSDTLKSLDKLKQSLDFANSTRGMNELGTAAKSFSLGNMSGAVEGVSAKFIALSTIAITALATITTHAIQAGGRILKSLTLDPVLQGFQEYETNMNSIQTILANTDSKGTTLKQVNAALDELNTYADQTIYNFSEMTRNIGTFTAAGIDLDSSTQAIKGIANLAAISGSNSQQASTAMYQLSQALASGSVKLMDWNSIVNAGMGGEVFQKALFETGKALGTIADVPMDQTFEQWKDAGNTFRDSLQDGWITTDVLTATLKGFTGDLTEAQVMALGYTKEQAAEVMRLGKIGKAAATEVKTFTQLIDTVKEAIGSGWSSSFRILFGDFEEAKKLFTEISEGIGTVVGKSADARNELLQGWKDLGGRDHLLQGFRDAIAGISSVLAPIKEAFREIFPPMTAERLYELTTRFSAFMQSLRIGEGTAEKLKSAFKGFFAALEIGWEIFKGILGVIGDLLGNLSGAGGGILDFASTTGDTLTALNEALVAGGGIRDFFEKIGDVVKNPMKALKQFRDYLVELFEEFTGFEDVSKGLGKLSDRLSDRFEMLGGVVERVGDAWQWLSDRFKGVREALSTVWGHLSTWFGELRDKLAAVFQPSDFDGAVDAVNVGLLGGILAILGKFLHGGFKFDFGSGLVENMTDAFEQLTGTLKAMQTDLRAKALLKIAAAVGILAISVVALSLIDSASLAKAMTALTVGFGQLIGAMALMDKLSFGTGAIKLGALATGMIILAVAVGVLSIAVRNLSNLGWEELAKGLLGVTVLLVGLTSATKLIAADTGGMIRAGVAMIGISIALLILSQAVKAFADMSWGEMAKGLIGVAVGLGALTTAMNFMPTSGMVSAGLGMIAISVGLLVLAEAVEAFADISWGEMAKGFVGIGVGLAIIAGAMHLMPPGMPIMAGGILILSAALLVMAKAVESMGSIDFGSMAKGIGGFAVMLGILAIALNVMNGTAAGSASLFIASGALLVLTQVLKQLGKMSIGELVASLLALAGVLTILGIAAIVLGPLTPALLGLGIALGLIGASFALFGVGAMLVAKAFEIMAKAGKTGIKVLIESIKLFISAMPEFVGAFVKSIAELAEELLAAAPVLVKGLTVLLGHILETITELTPKIGEAIGAIMSTGLTLMREKIPEFIETGYVVLMALLQGIRDNIAEITMVGAHIVVNFVLALKQNVFMLVNAAVELLTAFLGALSERIGDITAAGMNLLVNFLLGISNNITKVTQAVTLIIITFLAQVAASILQIVAAGLSLLVALLKGISDNINKVVDVVTNIITTFISNLGVNAGKIIEAGLKVLTDLLSGISNNLIKVVNTVGEVVTKFIGAIGENAGKIITAGTDLLIDFLEGISDNSQRVVNTAVSVVLDFLGAIGDQAIRLARGAADMIIDFVDALADTIDEKAPELRAAGKRLAGAIIDGATLGLASKAKALADKAVGVFQGAVGGVKGFLGMNSPSKLFMSIGKDMAVGTAIALGKDRSVVNSAVSLADKVVTAFKDSLNGVPDALAGMDEMNPVITPVLDLTKIQSASKGLDALMSVAAISPDVSIDRARTISTTKDVADTGADAPAYAGPAEVTFEQNIYSPTALSTNDIYRNTKSQIALAKEELNI